MEDDVFREIPPYHIDEEPMPAVAIFSEHYKKAKAESEQIFDDIIAHINQCPYGDEVILGSRKMIERARKVEPRGNVGIGLFGDAEVGKSSLINALFGKLQLARTVSPILNNEVSFLLAHLHIGRGRWELHASRTDLWSSFSKPDAPFGGTDQADEHQVI